MPLLSASPGDSVPKTPPTPRDTYHGLQSHTVILSNPIYPSIPTGAQRVGFSITTHCGHAGRSPALKKSIQPLHAWNIPAMHHSHHPGVTGNSTSVFHPFPGVLQIASRTKSPCFDSCTPSSQDLHQPAQACLAAGIDVCSLPLLHSNLLTPCLSLITLHPYRPQVEGTCRRAPYHHGRQLVTATWITARKVSPFSCRCTSSELRNWLINEGVNKWLCLFLPLLNSHRTARLVSALPSIITSGSKIISDPLITTQTRSTAGSHEMGILSSPPVAPVCFSLPCLYLKQDDICPTDLWEHGQGFQ